LSTFNDYPAREYAASAAEVHGDRESTGRRYSLICIEKCSARIWRRGVANRAQDKCPPYTADDYVCVTHPTTLRNFKNSLETLHQYTETGLSMIFNGECGRYESTRFVEQTFIPKGGAANATTYDPWSGVAQPWTNGLSSWAFFMGGDTVTEAVCVPEEIRAKIPGDYGRSRGIAWYYLGGFGIVHPDQLNARIVMWDSAQ